jgi:hypothetical protein
MAEADPVLVYEEAELQGMELWLTILTHPGF